MLRSSLRRAANTAATGSASSTAAAASAATGSATVSGPAPAPPALLSRSAMLSLYRLVLRHAAVFPSSKRKGILREIRADFRANASISDAHKAHAAQTRAVDGLHHLRQYSQLNSANRGAWNLQLGQK